MIVLFS